MADPGSRNVAEVAVAAKARVVHLSTDAQFAGRPSPYTERDTPDPITDYGVDKRDTELLVASIDPTAAIIRTSLLDGTDQLSPFQVDLQRSLPTGRSPMTLFTDEYRCPAHADDVAAAISMVTNQRDVGGCSTSLGLTGCRASTMGWCALVCARHLGSATRRLRVLRSPDRV